MSRIQLTDSSKDVIVKMSEGNPGAMNALLEILTKGEAIDPDGAFGGLGAILLLDTYGIYGTDIYVLWSDICNRDTPKTLAVLRAAQLGLFSDNTLTAAAHAQDHSGRDMVPVDELYEKVRERLPRFDAINQPQPEENKQD